MRRRLGLLILSGLVAFSINLGGPINLGGSIGVRLAVAQEATQTIYVVQPGDTLSSIARRYGLTTAELATANGVINPNLIYVGLKLIIPAASTAPRSATAKSASVVNRLHTVQADETLFVIALKYGTSIRSLIETNQLDRSGFIVAGQELIIPADARSNRAGVAQPTTPLPAPFTHIEIGQLPLYQGSVLEVTVNTTGPVMLTGQFGARSIPFAQDGDHYVGVVGVGAHPVSGVMPGLHSLVITATQETASPTVVVSNVEIRPGHYNSEYIRLSADRQQLLDPALVTAEINKLNAVWTVFNPARYWTGLFRVPVDQFIRISSPFGTRRSYDGGPFSSYHEGTDFAIAAGTPVYAPADGVVMLAEQLTVRGNAVVIDHGWGIYSGLYHLSEIKVVPGQPVKQGDLLALSGNTGLSTGAHLHWDIRIRGLNVDAMQFTRQVFP
ncbi:MAG TPA: LysM peptidoglycan-binding domain-containing protein [Anaerolineae bacterium]|nr:LysM peptidoglycan-binding domain-containing protein [Anaerolineae bacterium]